mmetsp:Transcript_19190/g.56994  ORF Transcript_19190/g.56994 Transcript_19190/m.56994 type:complete len:314 (-) Transcript_19190:242-1183(-)
MRRTSAVTPAARDGWSSTHGVGCRRGTPTSRGHVDRRSTGVAEAAASALDSAAARLTRRIGSVSSCMPVRQRVSRYQHALKARAAVTGPTPPPVKPPTVVQDAASAPPSPPPVAAPAQPQPTWSAELLRKGPSSQTGRHVCKAKSQDVFVCAAALGLVAYEYAVAPVQWRLRSPGPMQASFVGGPGAAGQVQQVVDQDSGLLPWVVISKRQRRRESVNDEVSSAVYQRLVADYQGAAAENEVWRLVRGAYEQRALQLAEADAACQLYRSLVADMQHWVDAEAQAAAVGVELVGWARALMAQRAKSAQVLVAST